MRMHPRAGYHEQESALSGIASGAGVTDIITWWPSTSQYDQEAIYSNDVSTLLPGSVVTSSGSSQSGQILAVLRWYIDASFPSVWSWTKLHSCLFSQDSTAPLHSSTHWSLTYFWCLHFIFPVIQCVRTTRKSLKLWENSKLTCQKHVQSEHVGKLAKTTRPCPRTPVISECDTTGVPAFSLKDRNSLYNENRWVWWHPSTPGLQNQEC